jgi:vancomycin permeability regulator SanA
MNSTRVSRRALKALAGLGALVVFGVLGASAYVGQADAERIVRAASAPHAPVALVFGAGLESGSEPSPVLAERLDAAIALFRAGTVEKLLVSGDSSDRHHDEARAMQRYAVEHGVPPSAVLEDPAGSSTYDSLYRAKLSYGVERAILVSQEYHLPRALFVARRLGIEAWGVAADEGKPTRASHELRELLHRPLALVMVAVRPEPAQPR